MAAKLVPMRSNSSGTRGRSESTSSLKFAVPAAISNRRPASESRGNGIAEFLRGQVARGLVRLGTVVDQAVRNARAKAAPELLDQSDDISLVRDVEPPRNSLWPHAGAPIGAGLEFFKNEIANTQRRADRHECAYRPCRIGAQRFVCDYRPEGVRDDHGRVGCDRPLDACAGGAPDLRLVEVAAHLLEIENEG